MNIIQAIEDEALFANWFRDPSTWAAWRAFLRAAFGLPMTAPELQLYRASTGRADAPTEPCTEIWLAIGRRGGKSFVLALIAVFLACFKDYRPYLQPGERATIIVIAADRRQARTILRYVRGLLTNVPMLARMIERETSDGFDLSNSVTIEVGAASFRSVRGYTLAAALGDEIAFWRTDGAAEPDYEILDALRPGLVTIPGAMLLLASSPYSRRGALHDSHVRYHGKDGPVLFWKASTRTMNPSVPQSVVNAAMERDPESARAEWLGEFRNDISAFVPREVVQACVDAGERERPYVPGSGYCAFVDPSGGSSDSMTLAIGHREFDDTIIVDLVREIPAPFDPESAVDEFCQVLASYDVHDITGDRYAGQWSAQAFEKRGIRYIHSELPKSGLYLDLLPALMSGGIRLVDNSRLVNQLANLERRTSRGGKDSIDHPPSGKDDVANVVAGVAHVAHVTSARLNAAYTELAPLW
jgi:hypothetical protein